MTGRPRTHALMEELDTRARDTECDGPVDYAMAWLEEGGTLSSLALDIAATTGLPPMRATLDRILRKHDSEYEQKVTRARSIGALAMAENTLSIADTADEHNHQVSRLRIQSRQWVAERFNKDQLGGNKGVSVSVTVGSLHLQALQAVSTIVTPTIDTQPTAQRITAGE